MDGYQLHFEEASQAARQLNEIIEGLSEQLRQLSTTEETMLNDSLWYGPNKTTFMQRMAEYKAAVQKLLENAVEHHTKLVEILNVYQAAEA